MLVSQPRIWICPFVFAQRSSRALLVAGPQAIYASHTHFLLPPLCCLCTSPMIPVQLRNLSSHQARSLAGAFWPSLGKSGSWDLFCSVGLTIHTSEVQYANEARSCDNPGKLQEALPGRNPPGSTLRSLLPSIRQECQ